jgi:hypothetical protein
MKIEKNKQQALPLPVTPSAAPQPAVKRAPRKRTSA